jgi:hypothetical protein
MTTKAEQVLTALKAQLEGAAALDDVEIVRNIDSPAKIPENGLIVIRDGNPGEPDQVLGGFTNTYYAHTIEIEVYAQGEPDSVRDALFDSLLAALGTALETDKTFGGAIDGMMYGLPDTATESAEGGQGIKQGTVLLTAEYSAPSPLG